MDVITYHSSRNIETTAQKYDLQKQDRTLQDISYHLRREKKKKERERLREKGNIAKTARMLCIIRKQRVLHQTLGKCQNARQYTKLSIEQ